MVPTPQLVWFKRDLRIVDHAALSAAVAAGPVIPFLALEPEWWAGDDMSGRQYAFFAESAGELSDTLSELGAELHVHYGDIISFLEQALLSHGRFTLWAHQETGNAWTYARD